MNKYALIFIFFISTITNAQDTVVEITVKNLKGEKIALQKLLDGKRNVLINVGGTWCKPCLSQKPFIASLEKQFPQYLNVAYLFYRDSSDKIIKQFGEDVIDKPYYLIDEVFLERFGITTLPVNILVDYNGDLIKNDVSINDVGSLLKK